jgi:hypothetical protein
VVKHVLFEEDVLFHIGKNRRDSDHGAARSG